MLFLMLKNLCNNAIILLFSFSMDKNVIQIGNYSLICYIPEDGFQHYLKGSQMICQPKEHNQILK